MILSLIALTTILSGFLQGAHRQPPETDEGTAAHIFQLSMVAIIPGLLIFLGTAEWQNPLGVLRSLMLPAAVLAISFGALYYLEHHVP